MFGGRGATARHLYAQQEQAMGSWSGLGCEELLKKAQTDMCYFQTIRRRGRCRLPNNLQFSWTERRLCLRAHARRQTFQSSSPPPWFAIVWLGNQSGKVGSTASVIGTCGGNVQTTAFPCWPRTVASPSATCGGSFGLDSASRLETGLPRDASREGRPSFSSWSS